MIVISDTSAITSLIQIGRAEALRLLFDRVIIPPAVRDELMTFHSELPSFLEIIPVGNRKQIPVPLDELGVGEVEAIMLAGEISPDFLLIDDADARRAAVRLGLPVIGLLGVLIKAKRENVIDLIAPILIQLEKIAGFRVSTELKLTILDAAGERTQA
jgi:hypothetical protein